MRHKSGQKDGNDALRQQKKSPQPVWGRGPEGGKDLIFSKSQSMFIFGKINGFQYNMLFSVVNT